MVVFEHVVSLGHACAVAHELEHLGLRSHSGPFDWQASTRLEPKIQFLNDRFDSFFKFLNETNLYQRPIANCYSMKVNNIYFIHDFNKWDSLSAQLPVVRQKYKRRVQQFLKDIVKPTLFIYYLFDQADADWIDRNTNYILNSIKNYNKDNQIVYIADPSIHLRTKCFFVENDKGSDIAYDFTEKSKEILDFFNSIPFDTHKREENLVFFRSKKNKKQKVKKLLFKIRILFKNLFCKEYHHFLTDYS